MSWHAVQRLTMIATIAGFAAQSLLAALGSIQFVSNVFFAWFVLHERVRPPGHIALYLTVSHPYILKLV